MKKILEYFNETKNEIKKVVWPTKPVIWQSTLVVLTVVVVMTIIVATLDISFGNLFDFFNKSI